MLVVGCRPDLPEGPVPNETFLPPSDAARARHAFEGTLVIDSAEMQTHPDPLETRRVFDRDVKLFPSVRLDFYTVDGRLVPAERDLIRSGSLTPGGSFWDLLVFPGRIWSERDGEEWSVASFGFALANAMENDTHHGVAMFRFNESEVQGLRYQVVTQTAPYYVTDWFVAWGTLPARFEEASIEHEELEPRLPMKSWAELEALVGAEVLEAFDAPEVILRGLVLDGILYRSECRTPYGPLPYCDDTRFGIWSVTKTAGNSLAMLRLAEKYGPDVFGLRLLDYVDLEPPDDGWNDVTFGDALNMATGLGEGSETVDPNNSSDGYLDRYEEWYDVPSANEKIAAILSGSKHSWGPGKVFRYRDQDMFLLGAAIDGFLKVHEGEDADIWDFVQREIYRAVGIPHAPINKTLEPDGSDGLPLIAGGYYPTLEDLARIATLIHNDGAHDGRQILHREKLAEMMYETDVRGLGFGTSGGTYHMGMWHRPFEASPECQIELHSMSGWGGHRVLMLPNGLTAIHISREDPAARSSGGLSEMAAVAHAIRPLCP